ncbi:gip-2, partial [Pristionchus pacificus]
SQIFVMTLTDKPTTWKALRRSLVNSRFMLLRVPRSANYANLDDEPFDDFRSMDAAEVELALVDEMGVVLMGDQTTNIRIETSPRFSLVVNSTADPHTRDLIMHFERLVQNCFTIRKRCYQANSETGLSMTVRVVAKRCEELLDRELADIVETASSCHKLMEFYYQVMPLNDKLETAAQVLEHITEGDLVGGEVLTLLATRLRQSIRDDTSALLHDMERAAMTTFLAKLYQWIAQGTIDCDTTMEFVVWNISEFTPTQLEVLQRTTLPKDERTDLGNGFRVLEELCPYQFSTAFVDIVKCGRFLHILRASSEDQERRATEEAFKILGPYADFIKLSPGVVKSRIVQARDSSSTRILKLLRDEYAVGELFDVAHSLFLCLDVSWLNLLMAEYDELLSKRVEAISEKRLAIIWSTMQMKRYESYTDKFDLVLERDSVLSLLFKNENSSCRWFAAEATRNNSMFVCPPDNWIEEELDRVEQSDELIGWSALSLRFKCPSMLSPIFTNTQMMVYSNVFRLFLACHLAIHRIGQCMLLLPSLKAEQWRQAAKLFFSINVLLHRFVENWNLIVSPMAMKFKQDLRRARSIEEMASLHSEFLVKLGIGLRFNNPRMLRDIFALCALTRQIYSEEMDIGTAEEQFAEISTEIAGALCDSGSDDQMGNEMLMMMTLGR